MALLLIIYISFISLGLPDGVLGSAWPVLHSQLSLPLWSAGLISATVSIGTVVSSLASARVVGRFGTGKVTFFSVLMTALALVGYSFAPNLAVLLLFAIPLGLGAGSVDAALNNYVALHYKARHMSWLHSFWGIGASAGPAIIALVFSLGYSYKVGYRLIGSVQTLLVVLLFFSLHLWKDQLSADRNGKTQGNKKALSIKGVPFALLTFFLYCSLEGSTGLWATSYLVRVKQVPVAQAALWGSLYYLGITVGRIFSGFITFRVSNNKMIMGGLAFCAASIALFFSANPNVAGFALLMLGLGSAPIYPCMIHETPRRFGVESSQAVIGLQMASAYMGSTCMPPLMGILAGTIGLFWMPFVQAFLILGMILSVLYLMHLTNKKA